MQSYTIVIADDHPLVRTGVRDALSPENRYQVIGEASRRYEAFELVRTLQPDLLILDLVMDVSPTAEWLKQCQSVCPHLRILLLSSQTDAISVARQAPAFESRFYRGLSQLARDRLRPVAF